MDNSKQIDNLVDMLDNLMDNDGGHVNVAVSNTQVDTPEVETMNSNECSGQNMACKVPTLHIGIDDIDE